MTNNNNNKGTPSLHEVYQDYFLVGAAVNPITLKSQQELIIKHFNSITAENEMKFERLHPEENRFTFDHSDKMMSFAKEHGKKVRGHTLVWHNQTPDWFFTDEEGNLVDRETLLKRMETHISTVMGRYKGQIYSWDVVNEAVSDSGEDLLRDSKWLNIIGEDFIDKAFEYAHKADPEAALFYNDYNESDPEKREKIYTLVKGLVDRKVPIHGIGLQAHWNLTKPSYDNIRQAIERYASLGLQIHITEMDVSVFDSEDKRIDVVEQTDEMKEAQAERYQHFFELLREYSDVITSVTFWGAADDYTWLSNFPVRGRKNWPFVFDENHEPKLSFWKIVDFDNGK
ncbi:1,4-beta-xylanase [Aquibacillus halophilus]|uniref:Beta-xylanase n=1 Tax=Aquibacillus halophilus TaxID=930132 RepID=A0A6A8DB08_9BACI|nr:endo-1,4-beta-xylanase [Aquibacillus halophilus]MRH42798.1 1,4-beta-xylanase [Aquibacillus halophilus]